MATQTIEVVFLTGTTPTAKLFPDNGTDPAGTTITVTEAANRKGIFTAELTDQDAGDYLITLVGGGVNAVAYVTLEEITGTYYATSERAATTGGGGGGQTTSFSTNAYNQIVAAVEEGLPSGPALIANLNAAGGNTYCTVADVEARLSVYGTTAFADVSTVDGTRQSGETTLIEVSIEYANGIIDEHIIDLLHGNAHRGASTFTRPAGNAWLRDRAVDIACYRLATLGGRAVNAILEADYRDALDRLVKARNQQIRIPHLIHAGPTKPYALEHGGKPTVIRTRTP